MKFNGDILGHISAHWGSTFEGVLLLKQKPDSFFKRSSSFCEHWCRLKGNLLVILKNEGVESTDLVGVVFLERCTAKPVTESGVQNAFKIEFECGDSPILFAARSAEEANMWCNHIALAGLSDLSARRTQLREELRQITGKDPLDLLGSGLSLRVPPCDLNEFTEAGLEIQLSLLDTTSTFLRYPDLGFRIVVSVKKSATDSAWNDLAETEIQTKGCSTFLKTVKLNPNKVPITSIVKFSLLEYKDLRSSVNRIIGSAETKFEDLCYTSSLNLPLLVNSATSGKPSEIMLIIQVFNQSNSTLDFENLDVYSQQFQNVCENTLTRNYVFPHTLGENMRVVEFMGESRFCFQFPIEYLKSLITQEHLLYDSLLHVGMSDPTLECLRKERLIGMKDVIERYEICLRGTVDYNGPSFKRSTARQCAELDFVPTNLHVNRIGLLDLGNKLISFHDVISVGAFACASGKFKGKGLFQTLTGGDNPDICLNELLKTSPIVASVFQNQNNFIGRVVHLLSKGAAVVVRMSGDLTELSSRLKLAGQARVLAERLEKGMSVLMEICTNAGTDLTFLAGLQSDYDLLRLNIVELAELDSFSDADKSESTATDRERALCEIGTVSNHLRKVLSDTWGKVEESLWHNVLSSLAAIASTESISAGMTLQTVSSILDSVHYRHHTALCQALTTCITGLALAVSHWTQAEWKQMVRCGVPLHFEGLLSCYGEEIGMLENWAWAVQSLAFCQVVIRPNSSPVTQFREKSENDEAETNEKGLCKSRLGNGQNLIQVQILRHNEILLTIPRAVWDQAPSDFRSRGRIVLSLHPIHFNVGINEQQTLVERLERVNLQSSINAHGLASLRDYFNKYIRKFGAPRNTPNQQDVCDVLSSLEHKLKTAKTKPVEVLYLATEISSALNALRFTSCKSAKDRTAMSVSLEQTRWLSEVEGMHKASFSPALRCLRSTGLRLSNVEKNVDTRKYSFSRLQLLSFPKDYRPPMGTYSLNVQS